MLGLISITYYFAVEKVDARSQTLKTITAKQDFQSLDENVMSVVWQPGSSRTLEIADSGGKLDIQPSSNSLIINITDNGSISETVFNQTVGQVAYELPYSGSPDTGIFLKGDSRSIINQSGCVMTQLYIRSGAEHPKIMLSYRPAVSYTTVGIENNKPINNLRIYIVSLNTSDDMALYGEVPLRISCLSTQLTTEAFNCSYKTENLLVTSVFDGVNGQISIPIQSTENGAIINIQIVLCNVKIERLVR
jgi:hypothetical protein